MHVSLVLATSPIEPIVLVIRGALGHILQLTHDIGWSLVVLALGINLALWPLRNQQFKSAAAMAKIAPEVKALQARYKSDPQTLNAETMALYKERGVNPLASCLPLVVQLPIISSVYYAVTGDKSLYASAGWLWIGSPFAKSVPFLAPNLATIDYVLLVLYMISMYFSVRMAPPPTDPQQAQMQSTMAFMSPAMIGVFAFMGKWPSAMIVYWLSSNLFTMSQQYLAMRGRRLAEVKTAAIAPERGRIVDAIPAKGQRRGKPSGAMLPPSAKRAAAAAGASGTPGGTGTPGGNGKPNAGGTASNGAGTPAKPGTGTNAAAKRRRS